MVSTVLCLPITNIPYIKRIQLNRTHLDLAQTLSADSDIRQHHGTRSTCN